MLRLSVWITWMTFVTNQNKHVEDIETVVAHFISQKKY